MIGYLLKGALVEYGIGLGSSVPNVVVFQFNPESITRTIEIPSRPNGASLREVNQAGEIPIERISLTAHFTTQEDVARLKPLTISVGIGPQLAALEKMVLPSGPLGGLATAALDPVSDLTSADGTDATQSVPREAYPRILFIWGATRVIPVTIDSISIVEKQYDSRLNPTLAEVTLSMTAIIPDPCTKDPIATGAYQYTQNQRDALASENLAADTAAVLDLVHF